MKEFFSDSSFISHVVYDEFKSEMIIYMRNGNIYAYHDIPGYIYEEFRKAKSQGRYYNGFIKGKYI